MGRVVESMEETTKCVENFSNETRSEHYCVKSSDVLKGISCFSTLNMEAVDPFEIFVQFLPS